MIHAEVAMIMIAANAKKIAMAVETSIVFRGSAGSEVSAASRRSRAHAVVDEWWGFVQGTCIDGISWIVSRSGVIIRARDTRLIM